MNRLEVRLSKVMLDTDRLRLSKVMLDTDRLRLAETR